MQNTTFHKHVHTPTAITLNNVTIHPSPCGIKHSYFNIKLKEVATAVKASVNIDASLFSQAMHQFLAPGQGNEPLYYFHGDHLGSASWITDKNGIPVQHLQYLPFGEPYVSQHAAGGYEERFTFTAKAPREGNRTPMNKIKYSEEREEETGYGYFGARYYDSETRALWLSVDPMADKYPGISPYAYCAWNPVKLVDPDGKDIYQLDIETGALVLQKKTDDENDVIEAGRTTVVWRDIMFKVNSIMKCSKSILNGKQGQDISQTGFVTSSNLQEEALQVAVFISFSCHIEISGVGYEGVMGNQDLEVFAWNKNSSFQSNNPKHYSPSKGGKSLFHFHTHCGDKKGQGGYSKPNRADLKAASKIKASYGINTFILISRKEETMLYNENGAISPYVGLLPKSVHIKY